MTDKQDSQSLNDDAAKGQPLDQVLAEFIRRRDAGQLIDVESLCAARPDLADALRSYADGESLLREMALDDSVPGASALAETVRPGAARDTDAAMTGRHFGNYRVIRQLGQGGMGAVYLAEDVTLERQVALKIPKFSPSDGMDARERFFREARAAAALSHPNICPVHHADEINGTPFIAMTFIDGQPLSRFVGTDEFQDQRRVAEVVGQVAAALQHAHDHNIIHRDLKPGNVMLDHNGRPIVTDFGLARRIVPNQESRITQEGQLLGTPAYMSPEQIAGNPDSVSSSTDIYALGVVLFELLTSRLPFQGSVPEVIAGALQSEPPKPSTLRDGIDPTLETLCLQMLRKKPEQRPASMQDVSQHLQKWLDQTTPESVADQAATKQLQTKLTAEQQRIEKLLRAGKFESALKRLQVLARQKEPAAAEFREWAIDQIPRVQARPAQARRNEPEMLKMGQEWMARHDYEQAIQVLRSIPDLYRSEEAEELLQVAIECQEEADGLLLDLKKCVKDRIYDGIDDNLHRFLELRPGNQFAKNLRSKLQSYRGGRSKGRPYRFDSQGRLLAIDEDNFWSRTFILSAVVGLSVFGVMTWAITIYLRNNDQTIAVQIDEDWLKEQGGELTLDIDGNEHSLTATGLDLKVALGEHGFIVRQGSTIVHSPQTFSIEKEGRQVLRIDGNGMNLAALPSIDGLSNDQPDGGQSTSVRIDSITWPATSNAPRTPLPDGPPGLVMTLPWQTNGQLPVSILAFSPDGQTIAAGGSRGSGVWDLSSGKRFDKYKETGSNGVAFSPDGTSLYALAGRGIVNRHDAPSFQKVSTFAVIDGDILSLSVSADGKSAVGHLLGGGLCFWDTTTGRLVNQFPGGPDQYGCRVSYMPNGRQILACGSEGLGIQLINVDTGEVAHQYRFNEKPMPNRATSLPVSPDGRLFLASPDWKRQVAVVEVQSGRFVTDVKLDDARIAGLAFLPDGKHVLTGIGHSLVIWNPTTRREIHRFEMPSRETPISCVAVSPDGRFVISAAAAHSEPNLSADYDDIHVWRLPKEVWPTLKSGGSTTLGSEADNHAETSSDTAARTPLPDGPLGLVGTLKGHTNDILEITPSPDGRYLVSTDKDRVTNVWDLETSQVVRTLPLESPVYRLRFIDNTFLMGGAVGRLKRHRFDNGEIVLTYRGYPDDGKKASRSVGCIQPGHEAGTFVTCNFRGDVAVWSYDDPRPIQEFSTESVFQNAYPTTDGYLLSGFGTTQARLVDKSGTTIREMYSLESGGPVAVSPDRTVFLSLRDNMLKEIEISTGEERCSYLSGWVNWRHFTPDGRFILCQDGDYNLQIWDRSTQRDVYRARLPLRAAHQAVSADGRFLFFATAMFDSDKSKDTHEIYIWRLPE